MKRSSSSSRDYRVWIIAAFAVALCTLFMLSYRSSSHTSELESKIGPGPVGRPITQMTKPNAGTFKIPLYNRDGEQVVARMDFQMTQITEMNITTNFIEQGHNKKMDLFVMGTTTNPPFAAVVANPRLEAASADVWQNGDMEKPTRRLFEFLLNTKCRKGDHLVVDAGANLGYFASYAGVMGCRVVAFEPQPRLLPIIRTSVMVNGLTERFTLHNRIVSTDPNARLKIVYAGGSCTGCSSVSVAGPDEKDTEGSFIIEATRIDKHVKEDVLLMKVDVEGYEVLAIESAKGIFEKYNVQNILVEWFPARFPHGVERGTELLEKLSDQGYKIRHYDLRFNLPREWVKEETFPIAGKAWEVPRNKLKDMNENLMTQSYGEANLWISKEY